MLFAEILGSPEHPANCTEDLAQHCRRELLQSTSQAGKQYKEGVLVFQMLPPSAMVAERGNYQAFMSLLLMEDGEKAAGCGCSVLPLHAAASHNS